MHATRLFGRIAFVLLLHAGVSSTSAQVTWRRTYGGFGADNANSVRQTSDGGYIIAGSAGSFGNGASDVYVVRTDGMGEPIWTHTYGGPGLDQGVACRELADGYVIAGWTSLGSNGSYDLLLIRTDLNGEQLWSKNYGTSAWDIGKALAVLPDGFLLGGVSYGPATPQGSAYVVRTDLNGDTLWTRTYSGVGYTECAALATTLDSGILMAGKATDELGDDDAFVTKLDGSGDTVWTTPAGGDSTDYFTSVFERADGRVVAGGGTHSWNNTMQIYLAGFLADGTPDWDQHLGSNADAAATEVRPDHQDGYVLTGYNTLNLGERDIILTTTYANGDFHFGNNFGDGRPADGYSVDLTADGGYVVAGWSEDLGPGVRSMYVVKTDSAGQTADLVVQTWFDPLKIDDPTPAQALPVYPNPAAAGEAVHVAVDGHVPVQLRLFDAQGRSVAEGHVAADRSFTVPALPPGVYQVLLRDDAGRSWRSPLVVRP